MPTSLHLTLAEYDQMTRVGAFDRLDRKVELIRGELIQMNPAGPIHDDLITYLTDWSADHRDPAKTTITSQTGLSIPDQISRPEPDLMWIRAGRYRDHHPQASRRPARHRSRPKQLGLRPGRKKKALRGG